MLPFTEVPCKTLFELPPNAAKNALALAAVNKKWSRLPMEVRALVAQNMRRATPSAMAFKGAFKGTNLYGLNTNWIEAQAVMKREQFSIPPSWKTTYIWSINRKSGYVSIRWRADWIPGAARQ